jgi:hypothetical protein
MFVAEMGHSVSICIQLSTVSSHNVLKQYETVSEFNHRVEIRTANENNLEN